MSKVIIIYGPTAVGKSGVAIELAKMINGEIISADSMQIYKGLDIGSAKVTKSEMGDIMHYLIDIKELNEEYSVSDFCSDANNAIKDIFSRGKTPIIVGGTGLYIKSLISGYNFGETAKDDIFRQSLNNLSEEELYSELIKIVPDIKIDKHNKRRLIRALELAKSGMNVGIGKFNYDYMLFGLVDDRQAIYNRINVRVDQMLNDGLLDELDYLLSLNLDENALCMKAIGYKELLPFKAGILTLDECANVLKQKTRNYAKRQFTFMNQFNDMIKIQFCGKKATANIIKERIIKG